MVGLGLALVMVVTLVWFPWDLRNRLVGSQLVTLGYSLGPRTSWFVGVSLNSQIGGWWPLWFIGVPWVGLPWSLRNCSLDDG